ncbi:hypothetical protein HMPREF9954_0503 [Streptococcus infantis SK970]|nr:hypothetical protein HMPREF9954_0503 [Streptococcus infantis SK970]
MFAFLAIFYSPCKWFNRFSSPTSLLEMMKSCGLYREVID